MNETPTPVENITTLPVAETVKKSRLKRNLIIAAAAIAAVAAVVVVAKSNSDETEETDEDEMIIIFPAPVEEPAA